MKRISPIALVLFALTTLSSFVGDQALAAGGTQSSEGSGIDRLAEPSPGWLETIARKRYYRTNKKVSEATTGRKVDVDVVAPAQAPNNAHSAH